MEKYVLRFNEIDKASLSYVGGKGANLGEMTKANFPVPQGFCVTTLAYQRLIQESKEMDKLLDKLERVSYTDFQKISILGQCIREHITNISIPEDIKSSILKAWEENGPQKAYAVRSSATAEDLPTASFAGQQDTYLNICGKEKLLKAIQNCWASLFTDRAISYRAKNNFSHHIVFLSVVVQEMIFPEVSGIMFTADPISGRRKTISIDASFGLGEALVSGLVTADLYQVYNSEIIRKQISKKKIAIYSIPEGGTATKNLPIEKQEVQALPDDKILKLASLAQKIEAHYGIEQDIEWGFADEKFYILQSRPITSLYPLPNVSDDKLHVYMSFGHIQVMTDTMKPLTISLFKNILNFLKSEPYKPINEICEVGGRMFADVTSILLIKPVRNRFLKIFGGMDKLMASALSKATEREDFKSQSVSRGKAFFTLMRLLPILAPLFTKIFYNLLIKDSNNAVSEADALIEKLTKESEENIFGATGAERVRRIRDNMGYMAPNILAKVVSYWITGIIAAGTLEKKLNKKFGDKKGTDLINQLNKSLPGNVTTELGLAVADLSDEVRKYPDVIAYLEKASDNVTFYEELLRIPGGMEFKRKLEVFLKKYGMRCSGEIDITKPRWREVPLQLVPSILSNIRTTAGGENREKFKQGEIEAEQGVKEILSQFNFFEKRRVSRLIKLYRNYMGMREHHKFAVILQLDIFKRAILEEAHSFVEKGIFKSEQDVFYLTLEEIIELEESYYSENVTEHIEALKSKYEQYEKLTPPRVMLSNGEIINGSLGDVKAPKGALIGIPVSAGIVEGFARVVVKLEDAKLNPGEILVAPYTDPGWTPLFTSAVGLITEVGGMMTHGSVIAREYGIPAVVGIDNATKLIKDGAYIRINGTDGFIEILK